MTTGVGTTLANFNPATGFSDTDLVYMTQNGATVKGTIAQLRTALAKNSSREVFTAGPLFTGSISGTTLTVSAVASGSLVVGQTIFAAGIAAGTTLIALGSGTGGVGTYTVSTSQTLAGASMGAANASQFAPGFSASVTLAGSYGSINNILVLFDGAVQTDDTLVGRVLGFNPTVPVGIQQITVVGQQALTIGAPSAGTVIDSSVAAGTALYNRIVTVNPKDPQYGAKGNGVADDTAAFSAALTQLYLLGGGKLVVPAGTFILSQRLTYALPGALSSITIEGAGADITELRWTNASGGLVFNYTSPGHSSHARDLSITTTQVGGGTGLSLNQTMSLNTFMQTDIMRVTFRGANNLGSGGSAYWNQCYLVNGVCGTNVLGVTCYGPNNWGSVSNAAGGVYQGNPAAISNPGNGYAIYHNIAMSTFNGLSFGITYGSYTQGMTISQVNCQNTTTGFYCPPGATGILAQLQIMSSQIACAGNGISIQSPILNVMIGLNNIISVNGNSGALITTPNGFSFVGNQCISGDASANLGISIGAPPSGSYAAGTITGNGFIGLNMAVLLESGSTGNNVQSNAYLNCTTKVNNLGTGNTVGGGSM
ncbi:glycosyl hydrolase family 28-related protein [Paraburkholderia sp. RL17-383-BIF-A]|uniref:hypothetical protein n=1 Tax=Paraburkholderia sp. RL17-383-BIF-A TaxID=3031631 RepID=UPI0038B7BAE3